MLKNSFSIGDILFIEEGDSITADARLIESKNFATIESVT